MLNYKHPRVHFNPLLCFKKLEWGWKSGQCSEENGWSRSTLSLCFPLNMKLASLEETPERQGGSETESPWTVPGKTWGMWNGVPCFLFVYVRVCAYIYNFVFDT